jgi:hypothetical protein
MKRSLGDMGGELPVKQAIDPDQFRPMSAPLPAIRRGDAGMHSPDVGYEEAGQVDVRMPFSGRIV